MSRKTTRIIKHEHGMPNPIIMREEEAILAAVDRALASTSNSQIIGRNGELPLLDFLNRYLPYTLRAASGQFVPPSGKLSPQIDIMILDARYPLLCENQDGSVLAMLHSVIKTIEVKTRITSNDMKKIWENSLNVMFLASEVKGYSGFEWGAVSTLVFAYRSANRLDTIERKYIEYADPWNAGIDIFLLRLPEKDQVAGKKHGVEFHFEPKFESEKSDKVIGYDSITRASYTPLSDLYYGLVQDSYYHLGHRNSSFNDIGQHVMDYMAWSTCSWQS